MIPDWDTLALREKCTGKMLVTIRLVSITCLSSVLSTSGLFQTVIAPLAQILQKKSPLAKFEQTNVWFSGKD